MGHCSGASSMLLICLFSFSLFLTNAVVAKTATTSADIAKTRESADIYTPQLVAKVLNLTRQPLGNYFRATWASTDIQVPTSALPPRFHVGDDTRLAGTAIYNMLVGYSCVVPLHRLASDEIWHSYGLGNACITLAQFDFKTGPPSGSLLYILYTLEIW